MSLTDILEVDPEGKLWVSGPTGVAPLKIIVEEEGVVAEVEGKAVVSWGTLAGWEASDTKDSEIWGVLEGPLRMSRGWSWAESIGWANRKRAVRKVVDGMVVLWGLRDRIWNWEVEQVEEMFTGFWEGKALFTVFSSSHTHSTALLATS